MTKLRMRLWCREEAGLRACQEGSTMKTVQDACCATVLREFLSCGALSCEMCPSCAATAQWWWCLCYLSTCDSFSLEYLALLAPGRQDATVRLDTRDEYQHCTTSPRTGKPPQCLVRSPSHKRRAHCVKDMKAFTSEHSMTNAKCVAMPKDPPASLAQPGASETHVTK